MKNLYTINKQLIWLLIIVCSLSACKKDFLEKKADQSLLIPGKIEDFQALLDNINVMNQSPVMHIVMADDFYTDQAGWNFLPQDMRDAYLWQRTMDTKGETLKADWNMPYNQIFYTNVVLDGLKKIVPNPNQKQDYQLVKGSALFFRAMAFSCLVNAFTVPYNPQTAAQEMGLPMPLEADVNERHGRGTLKQVYEQVISDLKAALEILPEKNAYKTRPTKVACMALLAKIYLTMQDYTQAGFYADASLKLNGQLIDYNTISVSSGYPFPSDFPQGPGNAEVLFYTAYLSNYYFYLFGASTFVNEDLLKSYDPHDLRLPILFRKSGDRKTFKGSYSGSQVLTFFSGLTVSENYLIRAECFARAGKLNEAMADLNTLLINRWDKAFFSPLTSMTADGALKLILTERRKELAGRGNRWEDLRRLNQESVFAEILKRELAGKIYELPVNDKRYTLPIPDDEILMNAIPQNER